MLRSSIQVMRNDDEILNPEDKVLLDLAGELRRLAADLVKELRKSEVLPSLSNLAAMRPLQKMLTDGLSERVFVANDGTDVDPAADDLKAGPDGSFVGYL